MNKIIDRLLKIIEITENGKYTVFAKKSGISPSTIQNYVNGRLPNIENLLRIQITYCININWLLTGEGEMFLNQSSASGSPESENVVLKNINIMLNDMNEEKQREILKYIEEKKLLNELLEEKRRKAA